MRLWSESFSDGEPIPVRYAFGRIDDKNHVALADNLNPHLAWDDVPAGTRSFAVLVHDLDVPTRGDDVNQEGREVPADLPRTDFYHWVLVDVNGDTREIEEGTFSNGITPRGKGGPLTPQGVRQGINDFTGWFAGDHDMSGQYFGYDGPCPPWNDSLLHHYVFTLYALDVSEVPVEGTFTGGDVRRAIENHVLATAAITGTYSLNPRIAPTPIASDE